jgi:hypothetical protein
VFGDGLLDLGIEQPRLTDRGPGDRIDDDVAHLLCRQHDPAIHRGRAAGQAGAHTACHHRNVVGGGPPQHGLNLFGPPRPHHGDRLSGRRIQGTVLPVALGDRGVGDDRALWELGDQAGQRVCGHGLDLTEILWAPDPPHSCTVER